MTVELDDDKWKGEDRDDDSFGRTPRLCVPAPDNADVLVIFKLFFTVELLTNLVSKTNRYAQRFLSHLDHFSVYPRSCAGQVCEFDLSSMSFVD